VPDILKYHKPIVSVDAFVLSIVKTRLSTFQLICHDKIGKPC